jgi:hypothetical protein
MKAFFVASLSTALDLGIAVPEDVLRHVTPDVLSQYLPRPLWARLLTAALGAPRVDAQLVIETIGVPNLCEHVPSPLIWACLSEIAQRALGGGIPVQQVARSAAYTPPPMAAAVIAHAPLSVAAPPPPDPRRDTPARGTSLPVGPSIPKPSDPLADVVAALESDERAPTSPSGRARTPTGPRFRQSNTGIGRLATPAGGRRPQAQASAGAGEAAPAAKARRGQTEADPYDMETEIANKEDWKSALSVEDEQLVDWSASEETSTTGDEYRKR